MEHCCQQTLPELIPWAWGTIFLQATSAHPEFPVGTLKPSSCTCCSQLDTETTVNQALGGVWGLEWEQAVNSHEISCYCPWPRPTLLLSVSRTSEHELSTAPIFSSSRNPWKSWGIYFPPIVSPRLWRSFIILALLKVFKDAFELSYLIISVICLKYLFITQDSDAGEGGYSMNSTSRCEMKARGPIQQEPVELESRWLNGHHSALTYRWLWREHRSPNTFTFHILPRTSVWLQQNAWGTQKWTENMLRICLFLPNRIRAWNRS